jgi:hypothetical protein
MDKSAKSPVLAHEASALSESRVVLATTLSVSDDATEIVVV